MKDVLLAHPLVEALGWALLHFIWQGTLIAALVLFVQLLLRRAQLRYLIACAGMLLMLLLPIATTAFVYKTGSRTAENSGATFPETLRLSLLSLGGMLETSTTAAPVAPAEVAQEEPVPPAATAVSPWRQTERILHGVLPWLVAAWFVGALFLSLRFFLQFLYAHRFGARHSRPAPEAWRLRLEDLARRLRVSRPVRLLESTLVQVPTVIGVLRPVILVPASAFTGLTKEQLEAILAHELAHIRRYDYLVNLLQSMIEALLFYHPAVWWLSQHIRTLREHLCDDEAVAVCGDPLLYARALSELESQRSVRLALVANGGSLMARVRRLLGLPSPAPSGHWFVGTSTIAVLLFFVALGLGSVASATAQAFTVIPTYEAIPAFLAAYHELPRDRQIRFYRRQLYFEHVIEPHKEACGMEYLDEQTPFPYPLHDLAELTEAVSVMREEGIEQRVLEALERSSEVLSGPDMALCLFAYDDPFFREADHGVFGGAHGPRALILLLYPEDDWLDWASYEVARAYYEGTFYARHDSPEAFTLLYSLTQVGRSYSFANLVYPHLTPPRVDALTPEQEAEQWTRMQRVLDTSDPYLIHEFLFEDAAGEIPRWTGYTIGYNIVQAFLENNPEVSVEEWMGMDPREILERSGYDPGR